MSRRTGSKFGNVGSYYPAKKRNKSGNLVLKEWFFRSKGELARFKDLEFQELNGVISELEFQPVFHVPRYVEKPYHRIVFDFQYIESGEVIVEDFKGAKTAGYRLNVRAFNFYYGEDHTFRETDKTWLTKSR